MQARPANGRMLSVKRILATSLALALGIGSASAAGVMVVGHRGTGSNAPGNPYVENTLPSIEKAFTILSPPMASCRRAVMSPMEICPFVDMDFIFFPSLRIG